MKTIIIPVAVATFLAASGTSRAQIDNKCADRCFVKDVLEYTIKSKDRNSHGITYVDVTDITTLPGDGALLSCHGTFWITGRDSTEAKFTFNRNSIDQYYFSITPDDLDDND